MSVSIDSVLVRDSEPKAAALDDGVVLLSVRAGAYFTFNRMGSEVWRMLAEPCRVGQIFDALAREHAVDACTVVRDVAPFLQTLIDNRLVRLVTAEQTR